MDKGIMAMKGNSTFPKVARFIKLGSYESALICLKEMSYELKRDYMDIKSFHHSQVAKSILRTVIVC